MSFEKPYHVEEAVAASKDESSKISILERLIAKSKFKRSNPDNPNTELKIGEKRFMIEGIERGDSPDISQVQNLFIKTFGEEEVDPEEILRSGVEGKTPWETDDLCKYRIHVIKNSEGEVVSTVTGGLLDLLDNENNPTGKKMFMVAYAVTDPQARQGGLAREAYISAIMDAAKSARSEGKELAFAAGECTYTSERFWNNVGWKRVYGATSLEDKKAYTELKYVQPALDFDETTGKPAEDAGEAPEHLMIDSFGRMPPTKEEILQTIQAFYRWCNRWPPEAFENEEAYEKHQEYVSVIEEQFKKQLAESGQLIYLDQSSRKKAKERGVAIEEYAEADQGDSGKEDF